MTVGCPIPNPPAFTLPADRDARYVASPVTNGISPACFGAQRIAITQSAINGNGIYVIDLSTNPGTLALTHNWPESFVPTYPKTMYYDTDSGLIVALMQRQGQNASIGFFDPASGYVSQSNTAVVASAFEERCSVIPVRGMKFRVLVNSAANFWLVDTQSRLIIANYVIAGAIGQTAYCCAANVACVFKTGSGLVMFNPTTGLLTGIALEIAASNPVYVDSIGKILALKGTSIHGPTPYSYYIYNPTTGALEGAVPPLVYPLGFWGAGGSPNRSALYNFYLDRFISFVDDDATDLTYLAYYKPSDWTFTLVGQDLSHINWTPKAIGFDAASGNTYAMLDTMFMNTRPIV